LNAEIHMKLTPSQTLLLTAAANHPQQLLADFPPNLKGGALIKVMTSLGNESLIQPHSKGSSGNTIFSITKAGLHAIGIEPMSKPKREGSKQSVIVELMKRSEGATLAQMVEATGWQAHTVRGCMAGALKKKLGLTIDSVKEVGGERVYRVSPYISLPTSR
jgi:hypothetical protein